MTKHHRHPRADDTPHAEAAGRAAAAYTAVADHVRAAWIGDYRADVIGAYTEAANAAGAAASAAATAAEAATPHARPQ